MAEYGDKSKLIFVVGLVGRECKARGWESRTMEGRKQQIR